MHDVNVSSRIDVAMDESLVFGSSGFISAPHGDYWRFMKKLLVTKLLRPQAIEQSRGIRAEELEWFYANMFDKAMKKEIVEIRKETMKLTNNIICRMSMGRSCSEDNSEEERVRELVTKSFALSKKVLFESNIGSTLEKLGISLFKKEVMEVSHGFDELLERILVEHEEKLGEHQDRDCKCSFDKEKLHKLLEQVTTCFSMESHQRKQLTWTTRVAELVTWIK